MWFECTIVHNYKPHGADATWNFKILRISTVWTSPCVKFNNESPASINVLFHSHLTFPSPHFSTLHMAKRRIRIIFFLSVCHMPAPANYWMMLWFCYGSTLSIDIFLFPKQLCENAWQLRYPVSRGQYILSAMTVCHMIRYCYSLRLGFKCIFQLHRSGFSILSYGYSYHVTLCVGQPHSITVWGLFLFLCALFWCWVSLCVPFTNYMTECYFVMLVANMYVIFMANLIIQTTHVGFLWPDSSG